MPQSGRSFCQNCDTLDKTVNKIVMSYGRIILLKKDYLLNYINGKVIICILILLSKNSLRDTQQKLLLCLSIPLETGSSLAPLTIQ